MLEYKSYAKINLFLKITGIMNNGKHSLFSLMTPINLYDEIKIERSDKLTIITNNAEIPQSENIINKVFDLFLRNNYKIDDKFDISINKKIPTGGGLGGGSSNAAIIINFLNQYFNLKIDKQKMIDIATEIGDDVPFFLDNNSKIIYHKNEKQIHFPLQLPKLNVLLIKPKGSVSTKLVYDLYRKNPNFQSIKDVDLNIEIGNYEELNKITSQYKNDLTKHSIEIIPEIEEVIKQIKNCEGCFFANMSGSGSVCFGLFKDSERLDLAWIKMNEEHWSAKTTNVI